MKKVLNTIYYIVLACISFIGILLIISVLPIKNNIKFLTVLSGSMEPTIHTGSVVLIKPNSSYKIGEIVTFSTNSKNNIPTTHRIVELRIQDGENIFKTKGDANDSTDTEEVLEKNIEGKFYFSIPYLGYIIDFVRRPIGLAIVILIPALLIIYDQVKRITKEVKKMKEDKKVEMNEVNNDAENN